MGIAAWLDLDARDMLAFLLAVFFGYIAASALPSGPCAGCGPIVVSYHFFLIWLVLRRHREAGFPLPLLYVLATHTACVAVVAAVAMSEVDHPQVRFLRLSLAALASFECTWLFKAEDQMQTVP